MLFDSLNEKIAFLFVSITFVAVLLGFLYDKPPKGVPTIPGVPFFQHTFTYLRNQNIILDFLTEKVIEMKNKTFTFKILSQPRYYVTCDPKNLEYILKDNFKNYGKGPQFNIRAFPLLGSGIFNSDGDHWYTQRKISAHMFNVNNFKTGILTTIQKHCDILVQIFSEAALSKEKINVQNQFYRLTLDSIGEIAFGENISSLTKKNVPFADAFDYCQQFVNDLFLNPFWRLKRTCSLSGLKFKKQLNILNKAAKEIIDRRRNDKNLASNSDIISIFLSRKDEKGNEFDDAYIRDLIMNFLIAGRDTTAQALTWSLYLISQDEKVQEKMYEEVKDLGGYDGHSDWFDYNAIKRMDYLHAVFTEVLRLYPSVPKEGKYAFEDDVWPDGTPIKKGCWAVFLPYTMGRLEELWENPLLFNPERHLNKQRESQFKFIAFQAGPRTCLGQDLAYLEAKCVLARLIKKFKFTLVPGQVVQYENSLTLPTKYGVYVNVIPREC